MAGWRAARTADNLALLMGSASVLEMVGKSVVHWAYEWVAPLVVEMGDEKAAWSVAQRDVH